MNTDIKATEGPLLHLDVLLTAFHAAIWNGCEAGEDFDIAGSEECKAIQRFVRLNFIQAPAAANHHFPQYEYRDTGPLETADCVVTDAAQADTPEKARERDDPELIAASNKGYAAGLRDGKALGACGPLAPADAGEAVGCLMVKRFRGLVNTDFDYYGNLPDGSYECYTAPPTARVASLTDAARDVLIERRRQVEQEGWTLEHDDEHSRGQMALAAGCYAMNAARAPSKYPPTAWPWFSDWWKPTTPRRDLVKAGALILAELERLDRTALLNGADQ
ncbi:hypothetical protein WS62_25975 [Burkholderia sp. ABCPW 14]|uniref:hypothetical protein n=1 Tax=Burkholderia sp. ABCPW 14 TaxID=1637860 RepID=UPI000770C216|nr:hypothetical protein [Burkholderia sp. ABCPW 14]KVD80772.1 hypothetical protein WS62_25975 [Burkholderia sp. ABCPW 14]